MRRLTFILACAFLLAFPAVADAGIIVKRVAGLDRAERAAVRSDAEVKLVETLTLANTEVVVPRDGDVAEALAELNADPDVVYAEPDLQVAPASNDFQFGQLWGLQNTGQTIWQSGVADADIDAPEAWTRTRGAGAVVAVVDSGIDTAHADLSGQFTGNAGERGAGRETNGLDDDGNGFVDDWQGWDFVNGDNTTETQTHTHGTHVVGTIAALADNAVGVAGVAPEAKILPVKVFGAPNTTTSSSTIAQAFDYAGALGVPIVNASLGGFGASLTIENVIKAYPNTLFVIAAGNDGADAADYYPCNTDAANVVCVGASDNRDARADFSNVSATAVDLFAPGVYVLSTVTGSYGYMSGTSMATPYVAGVAALLASAQPGTTSAQMKSALLVSVDVPGTLTGLAVTAGRLNAAAAIDAVLPSPSPTPPPTATATPSPSPTPPPVTPTPVPPAIPTPVPVTPAPPIAPTPAPAPSGPVVQSLKLTGNVTARTSARVTYSVSQGAKVTLTVTRASCAGKKGCASAVSRWSETAKAGTRRFTLSRRVGGRKLAAGKYTLTVATSDGSRSVAFRVR